MAIGLTGDANSLVQAGWAQAQTYASTSYSEATSFLGEIENAGNQLLDIPDITVDVLPVSTSITPVTLPDAPVAPDLNTDFPAAPTEPTLTDVSALTIPDAPVFTADLPDIDLNITPPTALSAIIPTAPELDAIVMPDAPTITLPSVPSAFAINLPDAPVLTIADFNDTLDDLASPPSGTFTFVEPAYSSTLLDGLKAFLTEWVNGAATGLDPAVEQGIWDRAREREDLSATRAIDTIRSNMAGRGFAVPQGAMQTAIQLAMQDAANKDSGLSREVMLKQADLEQQNRQFAVTTGVQLEGQLLTYANQVAQRAYEVAFATLRAGIDLYQATVSGYNAKAQAFSIKAQVWKQRIDAELSKLEIYKAELEGQKLIGDLNVQQVEMYKATLQGVLANIEIYKAQVDAATAKSGINRNYIEQFAAQIQAYGELVRAKATEYEGFATQVKAQVSKADVFKVQADAYKSQVDGYAALTGARVAEHEAQVKTQQEIPLKLFESRVSAYEKLVTAESSRLASLNKNFETEGRVFASIASAESARASAEADIYRSDVQYVLGEAGIQVQAAQANVTKLMKAVELLIESMKSGAQVSAQLAASALSAVNLSGSTSYSEGASISSSEANNTSETTNNSTSFSEQHEYRHTA